MRIKIFFYSCPLLLFCLNARSQTTYRYYFDENFNITDSAHSYYNGVGGVVGGNFELRLDFNSTQQLALLQHFKDSSLKISNGLFVAYYPNATKEIEGDYVMGKEEGLWEKWDSTGHITDSSFYKNGKIIRSWAFDYYPEGMLYSLSSRDFKNQRDSIIVFNRHGEIMIPGDSLIARNDSDFLNDSDIIFTKADIEASFPGGLQAWSRYISNAITSHIDEFTNSDYGTMLARFIVDVDGTISDIVVTKMTGIHIAKVVIDALRRGPKWIPAIQNGHYVKSYKIQPVTLQNPDK